MFCLYKYQINTTRLFHHFSSAFWTPLIEHVFAPHMLEYVPNFSLTLFKRCSVGKISWAASCRTPRSFQLCPSTDINTSTCNSVLGFYSLRKHHVIGVGIPIINFRRSSHRLRFLMGVSLPVMRCLLVNRGPAIPLYMFNAHWESSCRCHFTVWYDEKYAYKFVFPKKIGTARVDIKTQGTDHRCDEHHAVARCSFLRSLLAWIMCYRDVYVNNVVCLWWYADRSSFRTLVHQQLHLGNIRFCKYLGLNM